MPPARALLDQAWTALTGEPVEPGAVDLTGPDALLPSAFPVTAMLQASVAASALAAWRLAAARGLPLGRPGVDSRAVAAAAHSERHVRVDGAPLQVWDPLSGFARAADGWVRLHANYPHHRARLLEALGIAEDRAALDAAVAELAAEEVEERLAAAGGCGVAVRSPEQWSAHEQGRYVASTALVERHDLSGRAPTLDGPAGELPAAGVRVLDLTRVIAGPVATRVLGALGADVLRIDAPGMPEGGLWADTGLAKRSALLDLGTAEGRGRLHELLATADVLVHGYRPGALARHGVRADRLAAEHPQLVVVDLCAWGHGGPWAGRRGFDSLVQAACGIDVVEGEAQGLQGRPGVLPAQALDHATGYLAAAAALEGLRSRATGGPASHSRLALARTAAWLMAARVPAAPVPAPEVDPTPWLAQLPSDLGRLQVVVPPMSFGGAQLGWPAPPPRWGAAEPAWAG